MNRREALLLAMLITAAIVVQVSLLPVFFRPPFKPDLLLIIMVFLALRGSLEAGAPLAWFLGMCNDVCSGLFLGLNALSFLLAFLVIKSVSDRLYAESGLLFVLTVAGVSLATFTANLLLLFMFTATQGVAYSMLADIIPRVLVNAFIASLIAALPGFEKRLETP